MKDIQSTFKFSDWKFASKVFLSRLTKGLRISFGYDISATQNKAQNDPNFIALGNISQKERIEIIKTGFQLQAEGKISLKKYYEGTGESTLFDWKGYSINKTW